MLWQTKFFFCIRGRQRVQRLRAVDDLQPGLDSVPDEEELNTVDKGRRLCCGLRQKGPWKVANKSQCWT